MEEMINLLGVSLRGVPLQGLDGLIDEYMNNDVLDTMCMVSREMLLYAGEEPAYKEILESMDRHVVVEKDILLAAEFQDEDLLRKVESGRYSGRCCRLPEGRGRLAFSWRRMRSSWRRCGRPSCRSARIWPSPAPMWRTTAAGIRR